MGFGGVRMEGRELRIEPRLPESWSKLSFPLVWQGQRLKVTAMKDEVSVENCGDRKVEILLGEHKTAIEPKTTTTQKADWR